MERLEFNIVLDVLNIEKNNIIDYVTSKDEIAIFKDVNISFLSKKYFAMIEGNIPIEVSNIICDKYFDTKYGIIVAGGRNDLNHDYYINKYYISTKEGLLIFMLEMFDYYARKNNLPEIYVNQYQNYLNIISNKLIKVINPNISTDEWMKGAKNTEYCYNDSYLLYVLSVDSLAVDSIDTEIRSALKIFDEVVNPFQNDNINFLEYRDIFEKIKVDGETFDTRSGMNRDGCAKMVLIDVENDNYVKYFRVPDGFFYILNYRIDSNNHFVIKHYFINQYEGFSNDKNGEFISISEKSNISYLNIYYNITSNRLTDTFNKTSSITLEQKQFILEKLNEAINYASSITIDKININKLKKRK